MRSGIHMQAWGRTTVIVLVIVLAGAAIGAIYASGITQGQPSCTKPPDGFLVIASNRGFNDSADHGAPANPWPVVSVEKGTKVTFVVCNTDTQPHSFQVAHYYDNSLEAIAPGKVLELSFVANETGTFRIFCEIPCSVHIFMQNGELIVS